MKAKLAIVFAVLVATVLLVVLMTVSPDDGPAPAPQPAVAKPPLRGATAFFTESNPPVAQSESAAPSPLPSEEELAAIEERLTETVGRLPALQRLKLWWVSDGPQMPDEAYEKARGLYLRFLDNFGRVATAQYRMETFIKLKDGTEQLTEVQDVLLSGLSYRHELTHYEPGADPVTTLGVCDGRRLVWRNGEKSHTRRATGRFLPDHLFGLETQTVGEAHPFFLNGWTSCDIDDGSRGYSRLSSASGSEIRFDSASGLLTDHTNQDRSRKYTYQQVAGLWFPQEVSDRFAAPHNWGAGWEVVEMRRVFSRVTLNEPVDEALFDLNKPF